MTQSHAKLIRSLKLLARRQLVPHALNAASSVLIPATLIGVVLASLTLISSSGDLWLIAPLSAGAAVLAFAARYLLALWRGSRDACALSLLHRADRAARADDALLTTWQVNDGAFADALRMRAERLIEDAENAPRTRLATQPFVSWACVMIVITALTLTPLLLQSESDDPINQQGKSIADAQAPEEEAPADRLNLPVIDEGDEKRDDAATPDLESELELKPDREDETQGDPSAPGGDIASSPGSKQSQSESDPSSAGATQGDAAAGSEQGHVQAADRNNPRGETPKEDAPIQPDKRDYANRPPRETTGVQRPQRPDQSPKDVRKREEVKRFDPWSNPEGERRKESIEREVYDPNAQGDQSGAKPSAKGVPQKAAERERQLAGTSALSESEREWAESWAKRAQSR